MEKKICPACGQKTLVDIRDDPANNGEDTMYCTNKECTF